MKVFISYRRDKGSDTAHLVKDKLNMFGIKTFIDTENIGVGKFNTIIKEEVKTCDLMVVVITEGSMERFLRNEKDDNSLYEIKVAQANGVTILPINKIGNKLYSFLIENQKELPDVIASFKDLNIIEYIEGHSDFIVNKIIKELYLTSKDTYTSRYLNNLSSLTEIKDFPALIHFTNHKTEEVNKELIINGEKYRYFGSCFFGNPIGKGFLSKENLTTEYVMDFDIRYPITGFGKIINNKKEIYEGYIVEGKANGFGRMAEDSLEIDTLGFYVDNKLIVTIKSDTTSKLYDSIESLQINVPKETSENYHKFRKIITPEKFSGTLTAELDNSSLENSFLNIKEPLEKELDDFKTVELEVFKGRLKTIHTVDHNGNLKSSIKNNNSSTLVLEIVTNYSNYWNSLYKVSDSIKFDTVMKSKLKNLKHPLIDVKSLIQEFPEMTTDTIWTFVGLFSEENITRNDYTSYGVIHLFNEDKKKVICLGILGHYYQGDKPFKIKHFGQLYNLINEYKGDTNQSFYIDYFNLEEPSIEPEVPIEGNYKFKLFNTQRFTLDTILY